MRIQLSLNSKADDDKLKVGQALSWLTDFMFNNKSIRNKLAPRKVVEILRPLIELVPYTPTRKPLYRILSLPTGAGHKKDRIIKMPTNAVQSFTTAATKKEWYSIANEIGARSGKTGVYRVEGELYELVNMGYLKNSVLPYLLANRKQLAPHMPYEGREITWFKERVGDFHTQKEVVAFATKPHVMSLVCELTAEGLAADRKLNPPTYTKDDRRKFS